MQQADAAGSPRRWKFPSQVVKINGPFVWHKHEETDDLFLVISGHLTIHLRDRNVELNPGELFVVPRDYDGFA